MMPKSRIFCDFLRRATLSLAGAAGVSFLLITTTWAQSYDGPAELPLTTMDSSLAATPAPGPTVYSSGDLQKDLNNATCGEVLLLPAGSVYSGGFTFPTHNCDAQHWIWVMSSGALPSEGARINPSYAGVASLPGRPAFSGPDTHQMAKIISTDYKSPITFADGAQYYRLVGLEITRAAGTGMIGSLVTNYFSSTKQGASSYLVIDRCWVHGTAQDETTNGVSLNGVTNASIIDSYFTDFHCIA